MSAILGKKVGMTSIYDEKGKVIPCTVIEAGPCYASQVKTVEKDGYAAYQVTFDEKKPLAHRNRNKDISRKQMYRQLTVSRSFTKMS